MKNKNSHKTSITYMLIVICLVVTVMTYYTWVDYGMNTYYLLQKDYMNLFMQFLLFQFIHYSFLHFLTNFIFLYIFWNIIEELIWKNKYILLFIWSVLFVWISIIIFSKATTAWISWFNLALIWVYMMEAKKRRKEEFNSAIIFLIINILLSFWAWISLVWHLSWAIWWIIFWYSLHLTNRR